MIIGSPMPAAAHHILAVWHAKPLGAEAGQDAVDNVSSLQFCLDGAATSNFKVFSVC